MHKLQKHGSAIALQICNSMQFPAKYWKRMPLQKRNSTHCTAIYSYATNLQQHAVPNKIHQTQSVVKTQQYALCCNLRLSWPVSNCTDFSLFDSKLNAIDTRKHECIQKSMSNEPKLQHY